MEKDESEGEAAAGRRRFTPSLVNLYARGAHPEAGCYPCAMQPSERVHLRDPIENLRLRVIVRRASRSGGSLRPGRAVERTFRWQEKVHGPRELLLVCQEAFQDRAGARSSFGSGPRAPGYAGSTGPARLLRRRILARAKADADQYRRDHGLRPCRDGSADAADPRGLLRRLFPRPRDVYLFTYTDAEGAATRGAAALNRERPLTTSALLRPSALAAAAATRPFPWSPAFDAPPPPPPGDEESPRPPRGPAPAGAGGALSRRRVAARLEREAPFRAMRIMAAVDVDAGAIRAWAGAPGSAPPGWRLVHPRAPGGFRAAPYFEQTLCELRYYRRTGELRVCPGLSSPEAEPLCSAPPALFRPGPEPEALAARLLEGAPAPPPPPLTRFRFTSPSGAAFDYALDAAPAAAAAAAAAAADAADAVRSLRRTLARRGAAPTLLAPRCGGAGDPPPLVLTYHLEILGARGFSGAGAARICYEIAAPERGWVPCAPGARLSGATQRALRRRFAAARPAAGAFDAAVALADAGGGGGGAFGLAAGAALFLLAALCAAMPDEGRYPLWPAYAAAMAAALAAAAGGGTTGGAAPLVFAVNELRSFAFRTSEEAMLRGGAPQLLLEVRGDAGAAGCGSLRLPRGAAAGGERVEVPCGMPLPPLRERARAFFLGAAAPLQGARSCGLRGAADAPLHSRFGERAAAAGAVEVRVRVAVSRRGVGGGAWWARGRVAPCAGGRAAAKLRPVGEAGPGEAEERRRRIREILRYYRESSGRGGPRQRGARRAEEPAALREWRAKAAEAKAAAQALHGLSPAPTRIVPREEEEEEEGA